MAGRIVVNSQKLPSVPQLPVPMTNGSIQWSESFEQLPSGTLTYRGVTEADLIVLQNAYRRLTPVTLGGIPLEVDTFTSNRTNYPIGDRYGYEVTINLRSRWSDSIQRNIPIASFQQTDGYGNIADLARKAGVGYQGVNARFLATNGRTITLQSAMTEIARINGSFVRYSNADGVAIVNLDATNFYQFAQREAVEDSRTVGELPKFYQAEVTGEFVEIESGKPYSPLENIKPFIPKYVKTRIVEEGVDADQPPYDAKKIQDLTLNFDVSGEKKIRKKLYYVGDRLVREEEFIYGYAYTALDILKERNPQKYEGNPDDLWQEIEYRDTNYIFEPQRIRIEADFYDPETNRPLFRVIHPDYQFIASLYLNAFIVSTYPDYRFIAPVSSTVYVGRNSKYLVEKTTTGWRLGRFAIETLGDGGQYDRASITQSTSPNALYAKELVTFTKIPLHESTKFTLLGERTAYNLNSDATYNSNAYALATAPFDVEFMNYYEADPRIRSRLPKKLNEAGIPIDYRFALIIPKIDFVEPFLVMEQQTIINSFAKTPHPYNNPKVSQPANRPILPPLTTGVESYNTIRRSLVGHFMPNFGYYRSTQEVEYDRCGFVKPPKEEYRETVEEFNASDPEFQNHRQKHETRLVEGRPPQAEVWQQEWERIENCNHKAVLRSPSFIDRTKKYYATSDNADPLDVGSQSFSYPQAQTSEQARIAVLTDLRIQTFQTITRNCRLTWHYPNIRAGDHVRIGNGEGAERVLSVSWQLDIVGNNNLADGAPLVLSQGTSLQLGSDIPRTVSLNSVAQNARLSIKYGFDTYNNKYETGSPLITRRNY